MRSRFFLGVLTVLLVGAVVGGLLLWSGIVDVAATKANPLADRVLGYASTRSIKRHASNETNPVAVDPKALQEGLAHYKEMCVDCHGGPGAEPEEFAAGLHPSAPDLASPGIQSFTDAQIYWVIENGIGSTGMPAFGQSHQPQQIWSIVAFVRHLPKLTAAEKAQLGKAAKEEAPQQPSAPAQAAPPAPTESTPAKGGHKVTLTNSRFDPPTLEVKEGETVEFENTDFIAHTATAKDGTFDTRRIDGGETKRIVAKKKGTFPYYCRYHNGMTGTLIVR